MSLHTLKSCWMRAQLQPPPGFRIESMGDAGGLILNTVPQYASMRLEEVIFQILCQVSMVEPTCSESRLYSHLASFYAEMQSHLPPRQSVYAAISSLIESGLIYYCGQGYNLMTPDKMHVANWLRSLSVSEDLNTDYRPSSRLEVSMASLVPDVPRPHWPNLTQTALSRPPPSLSSVAKADTVEDEQPSFRFLEDQTPILPLSSSAPIPLNRCRPSAGNLTHRLSTRHMQHQISKVKREASSTSNLNSLNRNQLIGSSPPTAEGISYSLIPHPIEREVASPRAGVSTFHEQQIALPRTGTCDLTHRFQLSESVFLSSGQSIRQSQHRFGRSLYEQRAFRFAKSADFQSPNMAFGEEERAFQLGEHKKQGSKSLLQWFKQGVRKLCVRFRRSLSRIEWPSQSMSSFPMFYKNTTAKPIPLTMQGFKCQPSWSSKSHQSCSRTATSRDIYPHFILPHIEHDCGSSVSNLRRCLSLAENRSREIGNGNGNAAPFSMEVIPEAEVRTSSQNIGPSSYLRRDSTIRHDSAWREDAASMLSLNATPNVISGPDCSPQSALRHKYPASPKGLSYKPRTNNIYLTRSGRDSGFIDIPFQQNFAQIGSSVYSIIHSHQPTDPKTQEAIDVKDITDAFEGLTSEVLKGLTPMVLPTPPRMPIMPQQFQGMAGINSANWWTADLVEIHQNNNNHQ